MKQSIEVKQNIERLRCHECSFDYKYVQYNQYKETHFHLMRCAQLSFLKARNITSVCMCIFRGTRMALNRVECCQVATSRAFSAFGRFSNSTTFQARSGPSLTFLVFANIQTIWKFQIHLQVFYCWVHDTYKRVCSLIMEGIKYFLTDFVRESEGVTSKSFLLRK